MASTMDLPSPISAACRFDWLLGALLLQSGCESAYYGAWEKMGVHKRDILVDRVEEAAEALFEEWEEEIGQITNTRLRSASNDQLSKSKRQYDELIKSMRRAESKMPPVLNAFQDQVLFLKHNLNAQAIASLEGELGMIETNVAVLIQDMETSIARSQAFIEDMQLLGGDS